PRFLPWNPGAGPEPHNRFPQLNKLMCLVHVFARVVPSRAERLALAQSACGCPEAVVASALRLALYRAQRLATLAADASTPMATTGPSLEVAAAAAGSGGGAAGGDSKEPTDLLGVWNALKADIK